MPESKNNEFIKDEYKATSKVNKDYERNPFEKYSGRFSTSFTTLLLGVLLSIMGLIILGYSEGIDNQLNVVRRSPLIQAENLLRNSGMVKLSGEPVLKKELKIDGFEDPLLYYEVVTEEKIDGEWTEVSKHQVFGAFSLGEIYVDASKARLELDTTEISKTDKGSQREAIYGVSAKNEIVVVGNLKNKEIVGGNVFVVTNKSNKDLIKSMSNVDTMQWWIYKVGALLLLTLGITSFVLPIITFIDILPKIGLATVSLLMLFAFMVSALLVFVSAVIITFWWLIFVVVGLVVILLLRIKSRKKHSPISFVP